jgi:hypothetical protein
VMFSIAAGHRADSASGVLSESSGFLNARSTALQMWSLSEGMR